MYVECYWIFEINKERNFKYSDIFSFLSLIFKINHCRNYDVHVFNPKLYLFELYLQTKRIISLKLLRFLKENSVYIHTHDIYTFPLYFVSFGNIPRSNVDTNRCLSRGLNNFD